MATTTKQTAASEKKASQTDTTAGTEVEETGASTQAVTSASDFSPSGAPRQPGNFDPAHPAIDNNPRAGTSIAQNKIDMNDPGLSMEDAVVQNLREQGSGSVVEGSDEPKTDEEKRAEAQNKA